MALGQDGTLALSVVGLVPSVFSMSLPGLAEVRASIDETGEYADALKVAVLSSSVLVAAIAAASGSAPVAIAGGLTITALTALYVQARLATPPTLRAA